MRRMYDSTTAADIPAGSDLVMGYVDGSYAWSGADWQRFPSRTCVRLCVFSNSYDAQVIDIEPGNNDAKAIIPWIREKWLRGETPTVYCFSDRGPHGYRISDVRSECDAASLKHPLFLITDFDNDPTLPDDPEIVGKQYANSDLTGGHYDVSVVRDFWPGVDVATTVPTSATGGSMFKDDPDAQAFVKDVHDSLEAIKAELARQAHHTHIYSDKTTPEIVVGGRTSQPLVPPVPGAAYFSSDDSLSTIGWSYPDGTVHFWQSGVELVK